MVLRAHGVRGELIVRPWNDRSSQIGRQSTLWLRGTNLGQFREVRVRRSAVVKDGVLLGVEGCEDRSAAQALRGVELMVPRRMLEMPQDGEYYHVDLLGMAAVDRQGNFVGKVIEVFDYPSVDCLGVEFVDGVREVPMLEPYLIGVDLEGGCVRIVDWQDLPLRRRPG